MASKKQPKGFRQEVGNPPPPHHRALLRSALLEASAMGLAGRDRVPDVRMACDLDLVVPLEIAGWQMPSGGCTFTWRCSAGSSWTFGADECFDDNEERDAGPRSCRALWTAVYVRSTTEIAGGNR
jgi:hypothetical protein